jgi:hypothetical protein
MKQLYNTVFMVTRRICFWNTYITQFSPSLEQFPSEGDGIDLLSCSSLPRFFIITKVILHAIVNNSNIRTLKIPKIRGNITIFEASSILKDTYINVMHKGRFWEETSIPTVRHCLCFKQAIREPRYPTPRPKIGSKIAANHNFQSASNICGYE